MKHRRNYVFGTLNRVKECVHYIKLNRHYTPCVITEHRLSFFYLIVKLQMDKLKLILRVNKGDDEVVSLIASVYYSIKN